MKILLYGINFAPELTGIGKYTGERAAFDHEDSILIVTPANSPPIL